VGGREGHEKQVLTAAFPCLTSLLRLPEDEHEFDLGSTISILHQILFGLSNERG
jgi:hypothetical protein